MPNLKRNVLLLLSSLLLLLGILFPTGKVLADDTDINNIPKLAVPFFTVSLIPPENQAAGNKINYFNLLVKPNQIQYLEMYIKSTSNKEQTITMTPTDAITSGGNISVQIPKANVDSSLKTPFTTFGMKTFRFVLKPNELKKMKVAFQMPEKEFDGFIIGGLLFHTDQKTESESKTQNKKANLKIYNDFSISLQVVLHENDNLVLSDLKVDKIKPESYKTAPAIAVNLKNSKMQYMDGTSIDAKVTRLGDTRDVHQQKQEQMKIAPNSNFDYYIPWASNQKMVPGKYRLNLLAKAQQTHLELSPENQKKQEWYITKDFTITPEQADAINRKNPNYKPSYLWLYILIAILIILFVIFLFWYFFTLGRKDTNKNIQPNRR